MTGYPHDVYDPQAARLREITGLEPIQILSKPIGQDSVELQVVPTEAPSLGRQGLIVGIRLFHGPREIILDNVSLNYQVLVGPVDAAAYAVETPLLPIDSQVGPGYLGEALRFVSVRWGVFSKVCPLRILARAWGSPSAHPRLAGYLVVRTEPLSLPTALGSCFRSDGTMTDRSPAAPGCATADAVGQLPYTSKHPELLTVLAVLDEIERELENNPKPGTVRTGLDIVSWFRSWIEERPASGLHGFRIEILHNQNRHDAIAHPSAMLVCARLLAWCDQVSKTEDGG